MAKLLLILYVFSTFFCGVTAAGSRIADSSFENIICSSTDAEEGKTDLHLLLFSRSCSEAQYSMIGVCTALEIAQNKMSLFDDYQVVVHCLQTSDDASKTADDFFQAIYTSGLPFIGIVADTVYPLETTFTTLSTFTGINAIAFDEHYKYSKPLDRSEHFYRISFPINAEERIYNELFSFYNWKSFVLISSADRSPYDNAAISVNSYQIPDSTFVKVQLPWRLSDFRADQITYYYGPENEDYRIFIILLYDDDASRLFCSLYKRKMYGQKYVFFGLNFWDVKKWPYFSSCNESAFQEVLEYSIFIKEAGINWDQKTSDLGIGPREYSDLIRQRLQASNISSDDVAIDNSGLACDAMWTLLHAANQSQEFLPLESVKLSSVTPTNFSRSVQRKLAYSVVHGISGSIKFSRVGTRLTGYATIFQMLNSTKTLVGRGQLPNKVIANGIRFADGVVSPSSEATPKIVKDSAMEYIYMSICIAASLGVVYSIGSICIYIKYRHKPGIKLLSPTINSASGVGSTLAFLGIVLFNALGFGLEAEDCENDIAWGCVFFLVLRTMGFCIAFMSLVSKMYRVHVIFNPQSFKRKPKKPPTDKRLLLMILAASAIQAILVLLYLFPEPPRNILISVNFEKNSGTHVSSNILACSKAPFYADIMNYMYIYMMLGAGIYYVTKTRRVKIKLLNESRSVHTIILIVVFLEFIRICSTATFALSEEQNYVFSTFTSLIVQWLICVTVFLPGTLRLIRRPNWKPDTNTLSTKVARKQSLIDTMADVSNIVDIEQIFELYLKAQELVDQLKAEEETKTKDAKTHRQPKYAKRTDSAFATFASLDEKIDLGGKT